MNLHKSSNRSLSQTAYEQIRQKIVTLTLPPGAVVDETWLQTELGVGRTPIREALKRLEVERLVSIIPRRGIFVTPINITDLQHLYEIRLNLECLAVELAAQRGTAVHWQEMARVLESITEDDHITPKQIIEIDEACHQIIYEAADNQFLNQTLTALFPLSLRVWHMALSQLGDKKDSFKDSIIEDRHIEEHHEIMIALQNGRSEEASNLMRRHIEAYQNYIEAAILGKTMQSQEIPAL